jgi:hypothetical protein
VFQGLRCENKNEKRRYSVSRTPFNCFSCFILFLLKTGRLATLAYHLLEKSAEITMNIAQTVEHLAAVQQPVQHWAPPQGPQMSLPKPRRDPSSAASVVVALCFMCLFIGVIIFTSYADRTAKSKPREPARNMPMVHLR